MSTSDDSFGSFDDEFLQQPDDVALIDPQQTEYFPKDIDSYPEKSRSEAYRRLAYIKWIERRLEGGWTEKNLKPLLLQAKEVDDLEGETPAWRTLADWHSRYLSAEHSIEALAPQHNKKGNHLKKGVSDTLYFWQAVNQKYYRKERPSIASVYQYYQDLIILSNRDVVEGVIKPISQRAFYSRIKQLPPYDVAFNRYGKQIADRKFRPVGVHIGVTRVMEKVEIDHTPLDLILMDDELKIPIGRPYLTALMDSYSKCIVGFHLGFREPSFDSVRSAILNTCLEKDYVRKLYPDVKHDWKCYGKIETLVVDNGAEFWSKNLDEACRAVVSDIQYNPVGQPWLKPYIERFFGILNKMLLDYFPGKTFSSTADLKDYNPQKYAVVRFSTFISVFHKWLIDVYHRTSNARETNIPYLSWQEGVAEFPPIKYTGVKAQRLIVELGHTFNPVLRKGGVHKYGIRYESPELVEYRKNTPNPAGKKKLRLFAKLDSLDLSCIYVYIKEQDQYIKVPSVDPENYTQGLSLVQHQTNRKLARLRIRGQVNLEDVAEARLSIDKVIQEEIEIVRQGPKRKPKAISGMKALAKQNNVSNVGESTVVPKESLQRLDNKTTPGPSQDLLDDWDNMVSDLDPYK